MKPSARAFVKGMPELQSLPQIYQRIVRVTEDRGSSAEEIAAVASEDPGITARLLRLVNSSFYSFPGQIDTVSRAVALVGTQQLQDLAAATCVIDKFRDVPPNFMDMMSYWRHSLACGVCARIIAHQRRESNAERLFLTGLLHDIGSVVICLRGQNKLMRVIRRCKLQHETLHQAESKVFGFDHAEVGAELLRLWRLPESLAEPVAHHHRPHGARSFPLETAIVHIADIIVHSMEIGSNGENRVPPLDEEAWEALDLDPQSLPALVEEVEVQFEAVEFAMIGEPEEEPPVAQAGGGE